MFLSLGATKHSALVQKMSHCQDLDFQHHMSWPFLYSVSSLILVEFDDHYCSFHDIVTESIEELCLSTGDVSVNLPMKT